MSNLNEIIRKIVKEEIENYFNKNDEDVNCENFFPFLKSGKLYKEQEKIYEGLITTYSIEDTKGHILNKFDVDKDNFKLTTNDTNYIINLILSPFTNRNIINDIIHEMNVYGWNLSCIGNLKDIDKAIEFAKKYKKIISLNFIAKFDKEVEGYDNVYYHLTSYTLGDKILKNGLSPRSGNKLETNPPRVYLLSKNEMKQYRNIIENLFKYNNQEFEYKKKYYILEVDTSRPGKIPVKLYIDPQSYGGVFTQENIDLQYIKLIKKIYINKNGKIYNEEKIN